MKIRKRLLAYIVCFAMIISLLPMSAVGAEETGGTENEITEQETEPVSETETETETQIETETQAENKFQYTWKYWDEEKKEWHELDLQKDEEWSNHAEDEMQCIAKDNSKTETVTVKIITEETDRTKKFTFIAEFSKEFGGTQRKVVDIILHDFEMVYEWGYSDEESQWQKLELQDDEKWIQCESFSIQCKADRVCKICGLAEDVETVDANLSQDENDTYDATCTDQGQRTYIAGFSSELCEKQVHRVILPVNPNNHVLIFEEQAEADCEEIGHVEGYTCSRCHRHFYDADGKNEIDENKWKTADSIGHFWGEWTVTKEPTCTEKGKKERTCRNNNEHKQTKEIEALGHDWSDWEVTKAPSLTEKGEISRSCNRDETHTETAELPVLNEENYSYTVVTGPTCEGEGKGQYTYEKDGCKVVIEVTLGAPGHDWSDWEVTKAPSLTAKGEISRFCKRDKAHTKTEEMPVLNNKDYNYKTVTVPTCQKEGTGRYVYNKDGQEFSFNVKLSKTSHHIVTTEKERTDTEEGSLTKSCSACGYVQEKLILPKKTLTITIGKSANVISDPSKCQFALANAKKYEKYFKLDAKTGKVTTKKYYSVKIKKSIPVKVTTGGETYTVAVKIKIPTPTIKIKKSSSGSRYRYKFSYKLKKKGVKRIKVRIEGLNKKNGNKVLDRYLSKPDSNSDSYVNVKKSEVKKLRNKIRFKIVAYYGKNVSEARIFSVE